MTDVVLPQAAGQALRETAAKARVLVIGSLNVDLILNVDSEPPDEGAVLVRKATTDVGGHAGNCASALAALGMSVSLVAAVGTDADGDLLLADLLRRGVDVSGVRRYEQEPTGRVVIPVFGEKHYMLLSRGANELLTASDVQDAALRQDFDAVMLFDPSREVLREIERVTAKMASAPILCWTPGGIYSRDPVAEQVVPHCDVLFLNRAEHGDLAERLPAIESDALRPELVLTSGENGSALRHRGSEWAVPARRVPVVDPTGAGDAFSAAYLLARLAGLEPVQRLAVANASGALAVGAVGARGRLARLPDLVP
ncbi:carbohydrate kinase family protein [Kitasatospora sp. HPMI-4]|uniref:carbohydrate kinase family protein n=1 Tax=Kitasatospora sp. HPMI-4 TaxID=3448443 RepID=UPI003F19DA9A